MARPVLDVGRHGEMSVRQEHPGRWTASAYIRDNDGQRRRVRAWGRSKTAARYAPSLKFENRESFLADEVDAAMTVEKLMYSSLRSSTPSLASAV